MLPKLKGWWSGSASSPILPQLTNCNIWACEMMTSIPFCPRVSLLKFNSITLSSKELRIQGDDTPSSPPPFYQLQVATVTELELWPEEYWQRVTKFIIFDDHVFEDDEDDEDRIPWKAIAHNLRHLSFQGIHKMVDLPKGMQYLTSLQSLNLSSCLRLKSMPVWISKLTSLTHLTIKNCCRALVERCWISTGEDWPHIQHITNISITSAYSSVHCQNPETV